MSRGKIVVNTFTMGSFGNPKAWVPYDNTKDCSQGFCSLYCPQWCYIIFPPPPPLMFQDDNSGPNFSPLIIAIIGILASALLLISYYAIISKYCGNRRPTRSRENQGTNVELEEDQEPSNHEPWHDGNNGLDEALIKSITLLKYKKEDVVIDGTDCSVCLSEFQEDESLRLLPKCSHAFHVVCIDTWLRSHSNCPLCRANIVLTNAISPPPPPLDSGLSSNNEPASQNHDENNNSFQQEETNRGSTAAGDDIVRKSPERAFSDLGNSKCDTIIEIREVEFPQIRRSASMDFASQGHLSVADILCITQEEDFQITEYNSQGDVGSSKIKPAIEMRNFDPRNRTLLCANNSLAMKRSFSSGRFSLTQCGRGKNSIIPL